MDIQAYISSGKLELFVLGELTEREREEVVSMAKQHPEIQEELDQIEEAMFNFDNRATQAPSAGLKTKIMADLEGELSVKKTSSKKMIPPAAETNTKTVKVGPWKRFAAAAAVVAVISSILAVFFAIQYYDAEERFTTLVEQNAILAEDLQSNQVRLESLDTQMDKLLSGNFERVFMKGEGLPMQEDARVDVFWDRTSREVLLSVDNLAVLDEERDYQLWAIGPEGPIGIGLVDPGERLTLQQMQAIAEADAFAITIEPKGGSQAPNLEQLVVLGEV
ncbi:anti-sigma factor [Pleomorphovibrio marinus]|uniref:anti-sigma factor n=1 Tax=Pleomorphovibrio marinus TaxID=2164132 RepID=UPI000E0C528F|nr:anti-sigma factor [Pleomorphovibrio marinus]